LQIQKAAIRPGSILNRQGGSIFNRRGQVKRILRKYKYPPDMQDAAVELILQQAQALGDSWSE
jgi:hypothetical protein